MSLQTTSAFSPTQPGPSAVASPEGHLAHPPGQWAVASPEGRPVHPPGPSAVTPAEACPTLLTLQVGHGDVGVDAIDGPASLEAPVPTRLIVPLTLMWRVVVVAEYGLGETGPGSDAGGLAQAWAGVRVNLGWGAGAQTYQACSANPGPIGPQRRTLEKSGKGWVMHAHHLDGQGVLPRPAIQHLQSPSWPWVQFGRALTAQVWRPPEHAGPLFGTLLGIGGHGRAEALAVPTRVTGARVVHAGLVEGLGVHLGRTPWSVLGPCCLHGARTSPVPWTQDPEASPAPGTGHVPQHQPARAPAGPTLGRGSRDACPTVAVRTHHPAPLHPQL